MCAQQNQDEFNSGSVNEELAETLSGTGEESFIAEEKTPVNRSSFVLFGIIILGLAGYYFMYVRSGPSSAKGANAEAVAADKTITQFLNSGDENRKMMQDLIKSTEKFVAQFKQSANVPQVPVEELSTNPFEFGTPKADSPKDDTSGRRKEALLAEANDLKIQSIMHSGAHKTCMINNTMYTEHQQIGSFTIDAINPSDIILRSGNFRCRLRMEK